MRRSRFEHSLYDYLDGVLDEDARRAVEQRLANDPKARALLDDVRAAREALCALRDRPEPPVSAEEALPKIRAAIGAAPFEARPRLHLESFGSRFYRRVAMAATLLLAITVGILLTRNGDAPAEKTAAPEPLSATERGLVPVNAADLFLEAERDGRDPAELPRFVPIDTVVPIASGSAEGR